MAHQSFCRASPSSPTTHRLQNTFTEKQVWEKPGHLPWGLGQLLPATNQAWKEVRDSTAHTNRSTQRYMTSPGRATISESSSLSFSKECSGKESPAQCPLAGPPEHAFTPVEPQTPTLKADDRVRLKKRPTCTIPKEWQFPCQALTQDHEQWELPQACLNWSALYSSAGTWAQPKKNQILTPMVNANCLQL